jgi:hypothetical protein
MSTTWFVYFIILDLITLNTLGEEYKLWNSSLRSFLQPYHFISLRPKYSPQHPVMIIRILYSVLDTV